MQQYIDKSAVVAEIEKRMQELRPTNTHKMQVGEKMDRDVLMWLNALTWVKKVIDSLETKEVDTWHLQEKEDIYNAVKDWSLQTFVCVMKDGTIQKFTGNLDEDYEGHINVHIYGANDDYDNVDDIVKWIEFT